MLKLTLIITTDSPSMAYLMAGVSSYNTALMQIGAISAQQTNPNEFAFAVAEKFTDTIMIEGGKKIHVDATIERTT